MGQSLLISRIPYSGNQWNSSQGRTPHPCRPEFILRVAVRNQARIIINLRFACRMDGHRTMGLGSLTLSKIQELLLSKIQEPLYIKSFWNELITKKIENRGHLYKSWFYRWKQRKSTFSLKTWNLILVIAVILVVAVCSKHDSKVDVFRKPIVFCEFKVRV